MGINLNIKHNTTTITDITSGSVTLNTAGKICNDNLSFTLSGADFYDGGLVLYVDKPTNLTPSASYTGSVITNGYTTPTGVTMTGNNSGTELGTYTAVYTPNSGYMWSDGTTNSVTVILKIELSRANLAYEFLFETDSSDTSGNGVVLSGATLVDGGGITGKAITMTSQATFTSDLMGANDWTTCFWLKSGTPTSGWYVHYGQKDIMGVANSCHIFAWDYTSPIGWVGGTSASSDRHCHVFNSECDRQWRFYTVVNDYSNQCSRWYMNGTLLSERATYTHALYSSDMYFGYMLRGTRTSDVLFDNVRGYKRVLSQAEINALYHELD